MRTIIWLFKTLGYLLRAVGWNRKAVRLEASGDEQAYRTFVDNCVVDWAKKMLSYAGATVEVHGAENLTERPAIFISNHQSDFDIPLLLGYLDRPHGIIAKDSISKIPLIQTWMERIGCIFIDRNDARKALRTLNEAGKDVIEGNSIIIFPEGTRSRGEEIGEFKAGAFKTAFKYSVPIVPLSIDGTYRMFEGNRGLSIRPAHVVLTILPPVETEGLDRTQQKTFHETIREMILEARESTRRQIAGAETAEKGTAE